MEHFEIGNCHHFRAGVGDEEFDFAIGVKRVELHHYTARAQDGVVEDYRVRRVGKAQAETVVLFQPESLQPCRNSINFLAEFAVGPLSSKKVYRDMVGIKGSRTIEAFGKQPWANVALCIQDPGGIERVGRHRRLNHETSFPYLAQISRNCALICLYLTYTSGYILYRNHSTQKVNARKRKASQNHE